MRLARRDGQRHEETEAGRPEGGGLGGQSASGAPQSLTGAPFSARRALVGAQDGGVNPCGTRCRARGRDAGTPAPHPAMRQRSKCLCTLSSSLRSAPAGPTSARPSAKSTTPVTKARLSAAVRPWSPALPGSRRRLPPTAGLSARNACHRPRLQPELPSDDYTQPLQAIVG